MDTIAIERILDEGALPIREAWHSVTKAFAADKELKAARARGLETLLLANRVVTSKAAVLRYLEARQRRREG